MGKKGYLAMRTDTDTTDLISSDLRDLGNAAKKLATHAIKLGGLGFGTTFLEWLASFAAIYLLILDRTNWKTNILTALLIPYIFFSLPSILFNFFSGQVGKWIAFIAVVLRLFFPKRFPGQHAHAYTDTSICDCTCLQLQYVCFFLLGPNNLVIFVSFSPAAFVTVTADWLEMPAALILLIVVAPSLFSSTIRGDWIGLVICLAIGCYLLQEHIRASGGFRNSFTQRHGISNTIGLIILLVYPVWALVLDFL
ncbi:Cold-regulated 413 plasma membrane protein 2 [Vitis vinifera]|uniref:Cold-regulated 413 plasma membrane protein 2 n=1 Tax=Vitis vinifera TaxID=29760 RepID=A0A438EL27_VITVI|nr:Cold-regulated 413 plasma membrane protein 2 [Vitis vinifera]